MGITTTLDAPALARRVPRRAWCSGMLGSDYLWALAFVTPYITVFLAFVIYPVTYGLWLGSDPASYRALFADPVYPEAVVNTLIYLAIGVNLKLFLALLLSGFFMRKGWGMKTLLLVFILPWEVPGIPSFISIHWMLNGQWEQPVGPDQQCHLGLVPDRRAALAGPVCPGAGIGHLCLYLEVAAVLDDDVPGGTDGDSAGTV